MNSAYYWLASSDTSTRPASIPHAPLPPWDASDAGGTVHTTQPPELVIPPHFADPLFLRADFNGVTLDANRWGGHPPMLVGANSTPIDMLMTPMLILYPRIWQDRCLTEHAERGYDDFVIAGSGWNMAQNGFTPTPAALVEWAQYLQSWGFRVVYWGECTVVDPMLQALVDAHALNWVIPGEEVDQKVTAQQYAAVLDNRLAVTGGGMPIGAHLSSNFPKGFPRDTFFDGRSMPGFSHYDGKVHLCWQTNPSESAGMQGANLYYARQRVNLGLIGGDGHTAPNSRVVAFETLATEQLYGRKTEGDGCRRSIELLFTTRTDDRILPVSGFGNGCRNSDGAPL